MEDLAVYYHSLSNNKNYTLSSRSHSYPEWAEALEKHARKMVSIQEYKYWLQHIHISDQSLPKDFNIGPNTFKTGCTVVKELDETSTCYLLNELRQKHMQVNDLLITAMIKTLTAWLGRTSLYVALESSSRDFSIPEVDISRTVGWFTSIYPVYLQLPSHHNLDHLTKIVTAQLKDIPYNGFHYLPLRHICSIQDHAKQLEKISEPEVIFDYFINLDHYGKNEQRLGDILPISLGDNISPNNNRLYVLNISNWVVNGKFHTGWNFSQNHYRIDTIKRLAENYLLLLKDFIRKVSA